MSRQRRDTRSLTSQLITAALHDSVGSWLFSDALEHQLFGLLLALRLNSATDADWLIWPISGSFQASIIFTSRAAAAALPQGRAAPELLVRRIVVFEMGLSLSPSSESDSQVVCLGHRDHLRLVTFGRHM